VPERILIFGGTFDPPHIAHAKLPPIVADQLKCDRLIYVPAALSPHKAEAPAAADDHRVAMLALALSDVPHAEISTVELERPAPSFTVDTLEHFRKSFGKDADLRLLIGADQALHFHEWHNWRRILELASPAVMLRPPMDEAALRVELEKVYKRAEVERWMEWTVKVPSIDISSTELRSRLASGRDLEGLLDPVVTQYVRDNRLYAASSRPIAEESR
jgi:nicotinate-nucleotide adenylyltransferase